MNGSEHRENFEKEPVDAVTLCFLKPSSILNWSFRVYACFT